MNFGFEITVKVGADDPEARSAKVDEISDRLASASRAIKEFRGCYVVLDGQTLERPDPERATFLLTATAADECQALIDATSWLESAMRAAGCAAPGWLLSAEQAFDLGYQRTEVPVG